MKGLVEMRKTIRCAALILIGLFVLIIFALFPAAIAGLSTVHMAIYGFLYCLIFSVLAACARKGKRTTAWVISLLLCIGLGAADEYIQTFIPYRCGSMSDFLADVIGILIAALLFTF